MSNVDGTEANPSGFDAASAEPVAAQQPDSVSADPGDDAADAGAGTVDTTGEVDDTTEDSTYQQAVADHEMGELD